MGKVKAMRGDLTGALELHRQAFQAREKIAEAQPNRRGNDYSGSGVHVAARIAALAEGGQVLASAETVTEAAAPFAASEPRPVALKGVSTEVSVVAISWS